ncbi:MAG TPA: YXWGXW repeat-containing protein [Candidatus Acidoferrum sp.]|nr:YXWGXW repeat-containing protein [Candidatus Acidoferrum sp.]
MKLNFKTCMGTLLLAGTLFVGAPAAFSQVSVGIVIGAPPPPRVYAVRPVEPGPGYFWIDGYWYPVRGHYVWHGGYWTRPPYEGARWIGPRHDGERFYDGYWDGPRGHFEHDHRWDKEHDRDHGRWHDRDDHDRHDHEDHDRH